MAIIGISKINLCISITKENEQFESLFNCFPKELLQIIEDYAVEIIEIYHKSYNLALIDRFGWINFVPFQN